MYTVLVIDDDNAICELVRVNLELSGYKCLYSTDPVKGFALARQGDVDLVILDVMMGEVDGYTLAMKLRQFEETRDVPIVMLTALGELSDKLKGFSSGVDDYLTKPFEIEELKARVFAVLNRSKKVPESLRVKELLSVGDITLMPENYNVRILDNVVKLTPTEFEIFNYLVQNHGTMVSLKSILKEVWGYQEGDEVDTIRVHIKHLRTKIDKIAPLGVSYIETIYGGGYRLVPQGLKKVAKP